MTQEQIEKGNKLRSLISDLVKHKDEVISILTNKNKAIEWSGFSISVTKYDWADRHLKPEFFPMKQEILLRMYLAAVDQKIEDLEKEFAAI